MNKSSLLLAGLVAGLLVSLPSESRAEWTKTEAYEFSAKTSLKITDPPGAKVSITVNNETKEDTLPAIFSLPDADAFVPVKVTAADGTSWSGKIEVKAHKQTVLKLTPDAKPTAAPAKSSAKFIGKMRNGTDACTGRAKRALKFTVMRDDGTEAISIDVPAGRIMTGVQLAAGKYSVRVFSAGGFVGANPLEVTQDNWSWGWAGCN